MNDIIKQNAQKKGHKYTHPESGKVELISWKTRLWMFIFGGVYLIYKGLWKQLLIYMFVGTFMSGLSLIHPVLAISGFLLNFTYQFLICDMLRNHYRKNGYKEGDIR